MDRADEPERLALTVPLAAVGSSSPRRTRLAVALWTIGLAAIAWIGFAGHIGGAPAVEAPIAAEPVPAAHATAAPTLARVRVVAAPSVVVRRTLGEDGLIGGIVFGDSVPRLSQADIERDGYRYYQALIANR